MNIEHTQRGFGIIKFKDQYGSECSLQKSSAAMYDAIWLGSNDLGLKGFIPNSEKGWYDVSESEIKTTFGFQDIVSNCRMHLTQEQVKELLPFLIKFVETGDLS